MQNKKLDNYIIDNSKDNNFFYFIGNDKIANIDKIVDNRKIKMTYLTSVNIYETRDNYKYLKRLKLFGECFLINKFYELIKDSMPEPKFMYKFMN